VDVFADWTIANFLNDPSVDGGRYAYKGFTGKVFQPAATISTCPQAQTAATVHQYAADYIAIQCEGQVTIAFTGSQQAQLIPTTAHSGRYAFWSNRRDASDTTLTREFDLTGVTSATLDYWAWWEIEKDFDYAYVEVSADGGQTWQILHTPSGTSANPNGSNLGWAYTGCSGGGDPGQGCTAQWVEEKVDLSAYAGDKIEVRFEYVTDQGLNYPSFEVDDIRVPELNYTCNFEKDSCGWAAQGFVRVDDVLSQTFVVQVIHRSAGQTTVERMPLDASNQGSLTLDLKRGDQTVLVVSGTAPFSTELASYQYTIK
jgi:immune inhibitor A